MSQTLTTSDYYEAGFYICLGYTVQKVELIREAKKPVGKFTFEGEGLIQAQIEYFNGQAVVNLLDFRRAYIHLNALLGNLRRETRTALKPSEILEVRLSGADNA